MRRGNDTFALRTQPIGVRETRVFPQDRLPLVLRQVGGVDFVALEAQEVLLAGTLLGVGV